MKNGTRYYLSIIVFALAFFVSICGGQARANNSQDVLLLTRSRQSNSDVNFRKIAKFYGLSVRTIDISNHTLNQSDLSGRSRPYPLAVGVSLPTLEDLVDAEKALLEDLVRMGTNLLIYDLADVGASLPQLGLESIFSAKLIKDPKVYKVSDRLPDLTLEFTGVKLDYLPELCADYTFSPKVEGKTEPIITVLTKSGKEFPIFASYKRGSGNIFLLSTKQMLNLETVGMLQLYRPERFSQIVPLMMFVKYAGGEKAWHRKQDFANFTIDDPWLVEPYGNLSFFKLLKEMEHNNFHVTIAFIAWNYDRFQNKVVSLLSKHSKRFSIAIHGNDHDSGELSQRASEEEIEKDISQSLSRMEEFHRRTGLAYSKVMIFPRQLGSIEAIHTLKELNLGGTVNARDVPIGARRPEDFDYNMYPAILDYMGFPLLQRRYVPPNGTAHPIIFDLFLDKPALFYAHQDYFISGMGAFNKVADQVNNLATKPKWKSLDYIMERLYLQKLNDNGNMDIRMCTNNLILENHYDNTRRYHINREEMLDVPIINVAVDGKRFPHVVKDGYLKLNVDIPPNSSRRISITYGNKGLRKVDISKRILDRGGFRIFAIRMLSELRDRYLSGSGFGRLLVAAYYRSNFQSIALFILAGFLFYVIAIIGRARS